MRKLHRELINVCEAQNHRCACCAAPFPHHIGVYENRVAFVRMINDDKMRSYKNSIVVCTRCIGYRMNYKTIWGVYNAIELGVIASVSNNKCYHENLPTIQKLFDKAGYGHLFGTHVKKNAILRAHPDKLPEIAQRIIRSHIHFEEKKSKLGISHVFGYTNKAGSSKKKNTRKKLYEEQNGLCIYDGYKMLFRDSSKKDLKDEDWCKYKDDPRRATFEHIQAKIDCGSNDIENLALACGVCNGLRSRLQMSSEEFKIWAQNNVGEIEKVIQFGLRAWAKENAIRDGWFYKLKPIESSIGIELANEG